MNLNKLLEKTGIKIERDDHSLTEYIVGCPVTYYHVHVDKSWFEREEDFIAAIFKAVYDVVKYRNDPNVNGLLPK